MTTLVIPPLRSYNTTLQMDPHHTADRQRKRASALANKIVDIASAAAESIDVTPSLFINKVVAVAQQRPFYPTSPTHHPHLLHHQFFHDWGQRCLYHFISPASLAFPKATRRSSMQWNVIPQKLLRLFMSHLSTSTKHVGILC